MQQSSGVASNHRLNLQEVIKQRPEREAPLVMNLGFEIKVTYLFSQAESVG
jgi:hypothetical protein